MAVELLLAYLLDLTLGDPPHWPHPVRWLGRLITALEPPLRRHFSDAAAGRSDSHRTVPHGCRRHRRRHG